MAGLRRGRRRRSNTSKKHVQNFSVEKHTSQEKEKSTQPLKLYINRLSAFALVLVVCKCDRRQRVFDLPRPRRLS